MSVQVPKGYKQTEVGEIPCDWSIKAIRDVCKLINGRGFKPYEWSLTGLPIIRIQNLNGSDEFNYFSGKYNNKIEVNKGQLLFAWSGSKGTSFGPHIWNGSLSVLNYHTWKVVPYEFEVDKKFFFHLLKRLTVEIESKAHGASALVHTQKWEMEGFLLPLPNKHEQQAIAEALSDADALIESLEQLIAKKRQIKQGAMQELLTGQRRLPGFSGEWIQQRLGDIAHIKTGGRNNQDKVENGEFPFFVRSATVERINTFTYDCEAILVPGEGGIGSIFHYIFGKFDVHQRVYAITQFAGNVSGKFIYYYMKTYFGRHAMENSVKATVDSLRLPTFQDFVVKTPSCVEEQIEITSILSEMEQELEMLEERLQKARTIKQSMMQELLTGRIRLI